MSTSAPAVLWGTLRYEFRMQVRRKALWITMFVFSLTVVTGPMTTWNQHPSNGQAFVLANWALALQFILPVIFGVFMADRLPRDFRFNVSELLQTLPSSPVAHLIGKYLGSACATALPILLIYSTGVGYLLVSDGELNTLLFGVAVFMTVIAPGLLFVAAFSIACPAIIWVPLYQFLFVGYWFWGNLLSEGFGIPTLNGTLLTPIGRIAAGGFFSIYAGSPRTWHDGVMSILLFAALASLALLAAHIYLNWVRAQE